MNKANLIGGSCWVKFMAGYFLSKTSHVELLSTIDLTTQDKARGGVSWWLALQRCLVTVEGAEIQKGNNLNPFHWKGLVNRGQREAFIRMRVSVFGGSFFWFFWLVQFMAGPSHLNNNQFDSQQSWRGQGIPAELCIWSPAWGSSEPSQTQMVLPDTFGNRPETTYGDRKAIKMFRICGKQSQMGRKMLLLC